jgi:hypothetical protein
MKPLIGSLRIALLAATLFIAGTSTAQAGVLADSAVSCTSYVLEQPFAQWEPVPFDYVLAPNGGFERRDSDWTLSGRARVVRGNETYYVHRKRDSHSLWLPRGSQATSRAMCVGIDYPTLRMFAENRGDGASTLEVEVLFEVNNQVQTLPIALLTTASTWAPTQPIPVGANILVPNLPDNRAAVEFRFTPLDSNGDWRIDDVYVDPYRRY